MKEEKLSSYLQILALRAGGMAEFGLVNPTKIGGIVKSYIIGYLGNCSFSGVNFSNIAFSVSRYWICFGSTAAAKFEFI